MSKTSVKVTVGADKGRLRITLPSSVFGKQKRFYIGLEDNRENRRKADRIAIKIEEDLENGVFDSTLSRYKQSQPIVKNLAELNIADLYHNYIENYKSKIAAKTTYRSYQRYYRLLQSLPEQNPENAGDIKQWLIQNKSIETAKRTLQQLKACCNWAVEANLMTYNPFAKLSGISSHSTHYPDPFSHDEKTAILTLLQSHSPYYYHYFLFCFLTGCRSGEATALRWNNVREKHLFFCESYSEGILKEIKNHKARSFPINAELKTLLDKLRSESTSPLVFPSPKAKSYLQQRNLRVKHWNPVVTRLVEEGKVAKYRNPYNTRCTWISEQIENGVSIPQVARLAGNTPKVIFEHYAGLLTNEL
ncbi:UNVERIFIED_CONTAM: hypothetical protein BEN50_11085 [Euhalothece sp. KZN 001]